MPATPTRSGDVLGERFQLEFRLPDAGLGEAWTALDRQENLAPVMVKLLGVGAPGDIDNPRSLPALFARMKRVELADAAALRVWGDHHQRLFIVLPRFEGRSLSGWIAGHRKARTRPAIATAQRLLDRVAGALDAARLDGSAGPSHGALSPRSVLMHRESPGRYDLRVLDFGLAPLLVPTSGDHPLDEIHRAPEQSPWTLDAETPRTDVFALAAMLAEILGTTHPSPTHWAHIAADDPSKLRARLASLRSDVPHAIWDVVARALSADPSHRPATPGEFRALLQQAWKKLGLWEKPALTPEPEPPEAPPTPDSVTDLPRTLFGEFRHAVSESRRSPLPPPPSPTQPPVAAPIALPVAAPIALPIAAPIALPIAAPIAMPIAAPIALPSPPVRLPATPETLPIAPPSLLPQRSLLGLGHAPLGAPSSRPSVLSSAPLPPPPPYDDTPTMLPGQMRAMAADAVSERTSIDVRLPLGEGPEETTGEDPPPFEDPAPTPPDGMPAVLETIAESSTFRYTSLDAPPPSGGRLRARTIGHDEALSLAHPHAAAEPEGTRMIHLGRGGFDETPAPSPAPSPVFDASGDPFAHSAHEGVARPAPVVERTMAINLGSSGVTSGEAPPNYHATLPAQPLWGAAPPPVAMAAPAHARSSAVWWIVGGVAVAVILMTLTIALRL